MKSFHAALVCLLFSSMPMQAALAVTPIQVQASMLVNGSISVSPQGSVTSYNLEHSNELPPVVAGMLGKSIPYWRFAPVIRDGKPVAATAPMHLRLVAKPMGDDKYSMSVDSSFFGSGHSDEAISYKSKSAPFYPQSMVQNGVAGTVYVWLLVNREGRVEKAATEQVNLRTRGIPGQMKQWRRRLAVATLRAARHWTFYLPKSGSHVDDKNWTARVAVNFNLRRFRGSAAAKYGQWVSYAPGPRHPLPWGQSDSTDDGDVSALPAGSIAAAQQALHLIKSPRS